MSRSRLCRRTVALTLLALAVLFDPAALRAADPPAGEMTMRISCTGGGGLGETTILSLEGKGGNGYFIWMSLNEGPTPLPNGWVPDSLSVGTDLLSLSASLPGFYSHLDSSGRIDLPLPIPDDSYLHGIVLYFQALDLGSSGPPSVGASNQYRMTLQEPRTFAAPVGGDMLAKRSGHTATVLGDGTILVAGGSSISIFDPDGLHAAEIYRPDKESFEGAGNMINGRTWHTATLLLDGRVLLAGGGTSPYGDATNTAEVYDPATRAYAAVGSMAFIRAFHTATLLPDGRVLIAGGTETVNGTDVLTGGISSTEIFDPNALSFSPGPNMSVPRVAHTAVALANGDVLIAGGLTWKDIFGTRIPSIDDSAQVYSWSSGSLGSEISMVASACGHAATRLLDGRIAHFGGASGNIYAPTLLATVQIYDPATSRFVTGPALLEGRAVHAAALLADGTVLVTGGAAGTVTAPTLLASAELWNAATGSLSLPDLDAERALHVSPVLPDLTALVIGGATGALGDATLRTARIFQP
ncbi:MAG: kelch repeat-containing protein [Planctomycetota bacterium]